MSIHPGAWLTWALCCAAVAASTTNPFYLVPLAASAWMVHAACSTGGRAALSFRVFLWAGLVAIVLRTSLVALGPVSRGSVLVAALEGLRLGVVLVIFGTFNSVADPARVLRMAPRRWHEPALAAALALSVAPRTIAAVERVREARRMRGIAVRRWRSLPSLAVPVLESGLESAMTLAESMDSRGHGRGRRTRYRPDPVGPRSAIMAAAGICSAAAFVWFGNATLSVPIVPLVWPEVGFVPLAAVLTLAFPAFVDSKQI